MKGFFVFVICMLLCGDSCILLFWVFDGMGEVWDDFRMFLLRVVV